MLTIFGLIISVVAALNIYRIAQKNRRRAGLWATGVFTTGLLIHVVIPFLLVFAAFGVLVSSGNSVNKTERLLKNPVVIIDTICLVVNIVVVVTMTLLAGRKMTEMTFTSPPPSPPEFK